MKDLTNVTLDSILSTLSPSGDDNIGAIGTSYLMNGTCEREFITMTQLSKLNYFLTYK